jgi:hypothetical protein
MAQTNRITNFLLLLFAIFIVVISVMNCIEYNRIINEEDPGVNNYTQAQWWFGFNITLAVLGFIYFFYRIYVMLNTTSLGNETIKDLKKYLTEVNKPEPRTTKDGFTSKFKKIFTSKPKPESSISGAYAELNRAGIATGINFKQP